MIFCLFDINEETIKLVFLRAGVVFWECTEFMLCIIFTLVRVLHNSRGLIWALIVYSKIRKWLKDGYKTVLSLKHLDLQSTSQYRTIRLVCIKPVTLMYCLNFYLVSLLFWRAIGADDCLLDTISLALIERISTMLGK